jgi:hypothetical protein
VTSDHAFAHDHDGPSVAPGQSSGRRGPQAGLRPGPPEERRGSGWDLSESLPERPAWHAVAACRGAGPQIFFPRTDDHRLASNRRYKFGLTYCRTCPVIAECLAAGESEVFGLWGGLTPTERAGKRAKAG